MIDRIVDFILQSISYREIGSARKRMRQRWIVDGGGGGGGGESESDRGRVYMHHKQCFFFHFSFDRFENKK